MYWCSQVRDRATMYLAQLAGQAGGPQHMGAQLDVSLIGLEKQLNEYVGGATDRPFDMVGGSTNGMCVIASSLEAAIFIHATYLCS